MEQAKTFTKRLQALHKGYKAGLFDEANFAKLKTKIREKDPEELLTILDELFEMVREEALTLEEYESEARDPILEFLGVVEKGSDSSPSDDVPPQPSASPAPQPPISPPQPQNFTPFQSGPSYFSFFQAPFSSPSSAIPVEKPVDDSRDNEMPKDHEAAADAITQEVPETRGSMPPESSVESMPMKMGAEDIPETQREEVADEMPKEDEAAADANTKEVPEDRGSYPTTASASDGETTSDVPAQTHEESSAGQEETSEGVEGAEVLCEQAKAHREEGNECFKKAIIKNLSVVLKETRLEAALKHYRLAEKCARMAGTEGKTELLSALKNIGSANKNLGALLHSNVKALQASLATQQSEALTRQTRKDKNAALEKLFLSLAADGLSACFEAYSLGISLKQESAWMKSVEKCITAVEETMQECCVDDGEGGHSTLCCGDRDLLHSVRRKLFGVSTPGGVIVSAYINLALGVVTFKEGVHLKCNGGGAYARPLSLTCECTQYLLDAQQIIAMVEAKWRVYANLIDGECVSLCAMESIKDAELQERLIRSVQQRIQGDLLLHSHLINEETPNQEFMWTLVDMYKDAEIFARGQDIENEAAALARSAVLFVLMALRENAREQCDKALQLVAALYPKDVSQEKWFIELMQAKDQLDRIERGRAAMTPAQKEKVLAELKGELDKIKKIAVDESKPSLHCARALLTFIYNKHAPKDTDHTKGSDLPDDLKKTLLKSMLHYHPDKQMVHSNLPPSAFGEARNFHHWLVLCEEITKYLNGLYSSIYGKHVEVEETSKEDHEREKEQRQAREAARNAERERAQTRGWEEARSRKKAAKKPTAEAPRTQTPAPSTTTPSTTVKVFVTGYPWSATAEEIKEMFAKCGPKSCELPLARCGSLAGNALLVFEREEGAVKALAMDGVAYKNTERRLKISRADQNGKPVNCKQVYCGSLSGTVKESDIRTLFAGCGDIVSVRYMRDRAFAYVEFVNTLCVDEAVKVSGQLLNGKQVLVTYAQPRGGNNSYNENGRWREQGGRGRGRGR